MDSVFDNDTTVKRLLYFYVIYAIMSLHKLQMGR